MENIEFIPVICIIIPVLFIVGAAVLGILFLILRGIFRKTRRKIGMPEGTGKIIREQLANFDQYIQNDPRQTQAWSSTPAPTREPALDLEDIDLDEPIPAPDRAPKKSQVSMPNWVDESVSLTCAACGAPQQLQDRICPYCGHQH